MSEVRGWGAFAGAPRSGAALCAVQAFCPKGKTLAEGEFISPEHLKFMGTQTGWSVWALEKPKEMDGETLILN